VTPDRPAGLSPHELASGLVLGFTPPRREPPAADGRSTPRTPREALEHAILPALLRPPCLLSFSGGCGSSAVLALAVELARREGLEPPVPATCRLARRTGVEETNRQERLIVRLGLTEWLRLEFDDELDVVGPAATSALRRHGSLWPAHAHRWIPLIEWASGGSLLTGLGDGTAFAEPALGFRDVRPLPWLVPAAEAEVRLRWIADAALRRQAAQHQVGWWLRLRQFELALDVLRRLGSEQRVLLANPLADPAFTAALAQLPAGRRSTAAVLDDVLPAELLGPPVRPTSAAVLWGDHSVRLAASWQGEGVDPALVDVARLRREWSRVRPDPRTFLLLQSVALARRSTESAAEAASV
jgi:hypothetical protein